jgi:hypothetical protein
VTVADNVTAPEVSLLHTQEMQTRKQAATSGQPVTYTVNGPATLGNNQLQLTGAGTVTVTASQSASKDYTAASSTQLGTEVTKTSALEINQSLSKSGYHGI